jgi:hypothetical protein
MLSGASQRCLAYAETSCRCLQGVGLCHGISGNGYALLALARATGEARWLSAAQAFALHAARHWEQLAEVPDRPASLYEVRPSFAKVPPVEVQGVQANQKGGSCCCCSDVCLTGLPVCTR